MISYSTGNDFMIRCYNRKIAGRAIFFCGALSVFSIPANGSH